MTIEPITTQSLSSDRRGVIVDYGAAAAGAPPAPGFYKARDYRVNRGSPDIRQDRAAFAEPVILANLSFPQSVPRVTAGGFVIKRRDSYIMGLPGSFDFLLHPADVAARDLLSLYGERDFAKAEILIIVKVDDVQPGNALRPEFGGWHTHASREGVDLVYPFSNVMGTEFDLGAEGIAKLPDSTLGRFGAEKFHRSAVNETGAPLRRIWGGLIAYPDGYKARNGQPDNCAIFVTGPAHPLYEAFVAAGAAILSSALAAIPPQRLSEHTVRPEPGYL